MGSTDHVLQIQVWTVFMIGFGQNLVLNGMYWQLIFCHGGPSFLFVFNGTCQCFLSGQVKNNFHVGSIPLYRTNHHVRSFEKVASERSDSVCRGPCMASVLQNGIIPSHPSQVLHSKRPIKKVPKKQAKFTNAPPNKESWSDQPNCGLFSWHIIGTLCISTGTLSMSRWKMHSATVKKLQQSQGQPNSDPRAQYQLGKLKHKEMRRWLVPGPELRDQTNFPPKSPLQSRYWLFSVGRWQRLWPMHQFDLTVTLHTQMPRMRSFLQINGCFVSFPHWTCTQSFSWLILTPTCFFPGTVPKKTFTSSWIKFGNCCLEGIWHAFCIGSTSLTAKVKRMCWHAVSWTFW